MLADDPLLTCRMPGGRNPVRIICDSRLRTPLSSQLVKTAGQVRTIFATCNTDGNMHKEFTGRGCEILVMKEKDGRPDLNDLMAKLGEMQIDSILLEGGGTLNWSALETGIVNYVQAYIAPKIFGGASAKSPVGGTGFASPSEAVLLKNSKMTRLGEDYLLEGEVDDVYRNR